MVDHDSHSGPEDGCLFCYQVLEYGLCESCGDELPFVSILIRLWRKEETVCQKCAWECPCCQRNSLEEIGDGTCPECAWHLSNDKA